MTITIFLVDDHTIVREGLHTLLEAEADFKVLGGAANGRDAVQQVTRLCPDVVLMDISMPGLNGIEATRQIRQTCPASQIIILSMYATAEHALRALQAGAQGYVLKESAGVEVINAVRAVHAGQRYLNQKIANKLINHLVHPGEVEEAEDLLARLSAREREIVQLVVEGKSSAEIAKILYISPNTVDTYRSRLMQKLGLNDLPSLVKFAIQHGLTSLD
ncbi:MAG TPA: response regulator transcription factor [Anaerolineae bacterium]|nr:response regulator transcription factor [Anaerolineae bacterium]HXV99973.1 response regulator transcription factor [Anaerolineae bacterium]